MPCWNAMHEFLLSALALLADLTRSAMLMYTCVVHNELICTVLLRRSASATLLHRLVGLQQTPSVWQWSSVKFMLT